jgi:hypothetical protein
MAAPATSTPKSRVNVSSILSGVLPDAAICVASSRTGGRRAARSRRRSFGAHCRAIELGSRTLQDRRQRLRLGSECFGSLEQRASEISDDALAIDRAAAQAGRVSRPIKRIEPRTHILDCAICRLNDAPDAIGADGKSIAHLVRGGIRPIPGPEQPHGQFKVSDAHARCCTRTRSGAG